MQNNSFTTKNRTVYIRRATAGDAGQIKLLIGSSSVHAAALYSPKATDLPAQNKQLISLRRRLFKISSFLFAAQVPWQQFSVAATGNGTVIGCFQVKLHRCGIREIATLCIDRAWRNGVVASRLIRFVCANHPLPLWGTCLDSHIAFQKRNGAVLVVDPRQMPPFLRRRQRLFNFFFSLAGKKSSLAVMVYTEPQLSGRPDKG